METKTMNKDTIIRRYLCTPTELHVREAAEGEAPSRTITGYAILFNVPCFNSMKVRLKRVKAITGIFDFTCFNSMKVRLKRLGSWNASYTNMVSIP